MVRKGGKREIPDIEFNKIRLFHERTTTQPLNGSLIPYVENSDSYLLADYENQIKCVIFFAFSVILASVSSLLLIEGRFFITCIGLFAASVFFLFFITTYRLEQVEIGKEINHKYDNYNSEWININITVMTTPEDISELEKEMTVYAEELGWKIVSNTIEEEHKGIIKKNVTILPESGVVSPSFLLTNYTPILLISYSIFKELVKKRKTKFLIKDYFDKDILNDIQSNWEKSDLTQFFFYYQFGPLFFSCDLANRRIFELFNEEKSRFLFHEDLIDIFSIEYRILYEDLNERYHMIRQY